MSQRLCSSKRGCGGEMLTKKMIATISFPNVCALMIVLAVALLAPTSDCATATSSNNNQQQALNYLLFSSSQQQQQQDARLQELLKDANHSHVSDAVSLPLANSIWQRMRQNALEFAKRRTDEARPTINRLLEQANVSSECSKSLNSALDRLAKLDQWAVKMYNAFGDFPASGFFEGSFTSMGSYHQCVDLDPNEYIGSAQYCTFMFQPIVPKRPRYHNILATVEGLANSSAAAAPTNRDVDMFQLLAKKAQYFYYTKLRLATCMPSKCDRNDFEKLGMQGVSCLQKEKGFNPDGAQIFALTILLSLAAVSFLGTLVHLLKLKKYFKRKAAAIHPTHTHDLIVPKGGLNFATSNNNNNSSSQVVLQQQALLGGNHQKGGSVLPQAVIHHQTSVNGSSSAGSRAFANRALGVINFLLHFSVAKNGRKLFDTSTSRHHHSSSSSSSSSGSSSRPRSMSNGSAADGNSNAGSSSTGSSQSDTNSEDEPIRSSNDITCVHGLRFWTISWIIFGHTMQYTEWAGFARAFQVEQNIVSFYLQPLLNATFSVDTFFLISGLLTTYVTWTMTRGEYRRLSKFHFLISRYLRLTPQVLLVILLFIIFPLMGDGPYWKGLIQKESDNCKQNWWVNALYLQAFVKQDHICNLVTWWLSIEMFYHFVSIFVVIALLKSTKAGLVTAATIGSALTAVSCYLHYVNHYPPNMLPTLLQRYEVWDSIVLKFFWTPYPHAPSYFVGLVLGYFLYSRRIGKISKQQVNYGWLAFAVCYLTILFGTYRWNNNAPYARLSSTIYYNLSQVFWSFATGWAILACAMGHGGWLNAFLSSPVFVPLGRATYMTYLSHMLIVMSYPAKMNLLIEPSYVVFLYIFISNLILSYALGIFLTLVYESPILHLQKMLVNNMSKKYNDELAPNGNSNKIVNNRPENVVRVSLYSPQPVPTTEN